MGNARRKKGKTSKSRGSVRVPRTYAMADKCANCGPRDGSPVCGFCVDGENKGCFSGGKGKRPEKKTGKR